MMTTEQAETVKKIYRKFFENEKANKEWTTIDESMWALSWLSDRETIDESKLAFDTQKSGDPKCAIDHPGKECFVPLVLEAVEAILTLYDETGNLHHSNRFILHYYLSLSYIGAIRY